MIAKGKGKWEKGKVGIRLFPFPFSLLPCKGGSSLIKDFVESTQFPLTNLKFSARMILN